MANKLYTIRINGGFYQAKYFNKRTAKKLGKTAGWEITVPTGMWWFDDTIPNMKREVLRKFPNAIITKVR